MRRSRAYILANRRSRGRGHAVAVCAFVHDLTNEWYATGVVFTKGRGDDLRMDHHRAAPYTTLWTELDCGQGASPFVSGGSSNRGPHTAAYDMLWNVRAAQAMALPEDEYGPRMSFVAFQTDATEPTSPYEWWFEAIDPDDIDPPNIWEAMRERRLGPEEPGETGTGTSGDTSGGTGNEGGANTGPADGTGGGDEEGGTPATGGAPGTDGATSGDTSSDADADGGCGCSTPTRMSPLLAFVMLVLRRRRRAEPTAP